MNYISQAHKVDGYKLGHIDQYIEGTEMVYSNLTPRSDRLARVLRDDYDGKMVLFGIEYAIQKLNDNWNESFFSQPREEILKKYARRVKNYLGSDHGDSQIKAMAELYDLGYLPLMIKALPEGSKVDMLIPVLTVKNTHNDFYWLTNYCETFISCMTWNMCNAASLSEQYYNTSKHWAGITGAPDEWIGIANHCFAARGHRGEQDSMTSGMAHLLFSFGTDTLWAIDGLEDYYGADSDKELVGCSVNAFEHATVTQRIAYYRNVLGFTGDLEAEVESIRDIVTNLYPTGIVSYVADSEDYYGLLELGLVEVREEILARTPDSLGLCKFVVRPDTSPKTPLEVIVGDFEAEPGSAEFKGTLQLLWDTFGGTTNDKGYGVLNPKVGVIYGEAINIELQEKIYAEMERQGWCVSNVLFGVGSWGFLEGSSRDCYGMAIKGTHSVVDGEEVAMQKTPKTSESFKRSAKGYLRVEKNLAGDFVMFDNQTEEQEQQGLLEVVYQDGCILRHTTLNDIRERVGFLS